MNFILTADQEARRQELSSFLAERSPMPEVRRLIETQEGYDPAVWRDATRRFGLAGLAVPSRLGGSGRAYLDVVVTMEEMGRALFCAPVLATLMASTAVLHAGGEVLADELLATIAGNQVVATLAVAGDRGAWSERAIAVTAERAGSAWVLHGTTSYVVDGCAADRILVAARSPSGVSLLAAAQGADGLTCTPLPTLDLTRKLARIEFDRTPALLIGDEAQEGTAGPGLSRALDLAAVALAGEQVGGAERCLDMAVSYAKSRVQFGRPIGSFQAVKHKCADVATRVELARSAAYYAGWVADARPEELPLAAAVAKAACSEAYVDAAAVAIEVHGGLGFTWDHDAHLHYRRARSSRLLLGDPAHHRQMVASHVPL